MAESLIKRRCVILIGDYEPLDLAQKFVFLQHHVQQFCQTWKVSAKVSPHTLHSEGAVGTCQIETKGLGWQVRTDLRILNWSDFAIDDRAMPQGRRIRRGAAALFDLVKSGTVWRYFRANWRFGLFFIYPLLALLSCLAIGHWLGAIFGYFSLPYSGLVGLAIALGLFITYAKLVDQFVLLYVVNMWIFVDDLIHLKRPGLTERLGLFTQDVAEQMSSEVYDEIIVVGHGLGAALQPVIVDKALWQLPNFTKDGHSVSLLSVGSLLLMVGLHSSASWLLGPLSRISRDRSVYWAEYQAVDDVISFPQNNPVALLIEDVGKPIVRHICVADMAPIVQKSILPEWAIRTHRQLVRPNVKQYFYDFFMICCGPHSLQAQAEDPSVVPIAEDDAGQLHQQE